MAVKWIKVMNLLISDFVIVTKELKKGDAYLKKWLVICNEEDTDG